jgi:hypothetical protein
MAVETWIDDGQGPIPTQEQCAAALATPNDDELYQTAIESGYLDETTGVKLKTTKHAQEMFTALVTMLQEGISLGLITNDTLQVIWDFNNEPVTLTVLQIRQLLFRYGMHCKTFFDDYAP